MVVAVLLLAVGHYAAHWPPVPLLGSISLPVGYSIVLFYVLAGFTVTASMVRAHESGRPYGPLRSLGRSVIRAGPMVIVFVAITTALHLAGGVEVPVLRPIAYLTLFGNYYNGLATDDGTRHVIGHLWSLSVGAHFVILWGLVLNWALPRGRSGTALLTAVGLGLASGAVRWVLFERGTSPEAYLYNATETRIGEIFFGAACALAVLRARESDRAARPVVVLVTLVALIASTTVASEILMGPGITVNAILTAFLIYLLALGRGPGLEAVLGHGNLTRLRPLVLGIFLWHLHGIAFDGRLTFLPFAVRLPLVLGIILGIAALMWFLLERPLRRWVLRARSSTS